MNIQTIFPRWIWRRLAIVSVLFILPLVLFMELADGVKERDTLRFDEAVLRTVNTFASPVLDDLMVLVTHLGGVIGVLIATVGLLLLLWRRRMRRMAVLLVAGVGGAAVLNVLLKAFYQRDRPELWERLVVENSYSFPSGHAMASGALACSLIVIFWSTRWRWWVVPGAGIYMISVGVSRLYLGVHYPTDVVSGWLVSAAWIAVVTIALRYPTWSKPESKKLERSL